MIAKIFMRVDRQSTRRDVANPALLGWEHDRVGTGEG
jgi:hypothetical protein